ncbi:MAG TPA: bifunctional diguanylate cyclase/phosphodiesterase [Candidatus Limnocylindrales bacterium]|nr:bifunctional diguanylate cyclase/phosphodiesterase [Candidatus Limnocylindrales bacterium]
MATATVTSRRETRVLDAPLYKAARYGIVALGLVYALSTVVPFAERPEFLDTWFYSSVLVLTMLLALARPLFVRPQRAAWACVAFAVTSWSVGDIYWSAVFSDTPADEIPVPSLADVFYIGMYPLAYIGFILLARAAVARLPASVWLDGVVTSLATGAVFCAVVLAEVLSTITAGTLTNLFYSIGDLVLIVISVAALAMVRWRSDPIWWLLGLGAGFFAIADTTYLLTLEAGTYVDGGWVDGLWMLGLTFMALAGSLNRRRPAAEVRGFVALLVPILFSLMALAVLIWGSFQKMHPVTIVLASGCLLAAGVRMALTFEHTRELVRTQIKAQTDEVSGLGNRRVLDVQLPHLMRNLTSGSPLVLTIISVNHVSEINSVLGYSAGDTVLNTIGHRLLQHLPPDAISARLGGVEIAILRVISRADWAAVERDSRALISAISAPITIASVPLQVELSAGVAIGGEHASTPADLLKRAQDALSTAKANRSEVEFFDPSLHLGGVFDLALASDLLQGVGRDELVTWYQPKVDPLTGRAVGMEGIVRWHHPKRGLIEADVLKPLAERVGLTRHLTRSLLESAVYRCSQWRRQGIDLGISVDLAAADVLDARLPYDLAKTVNKHGLPPSAVTLEIPEDVLQIDARLTTNALSQFRHFGMRMALDHYGRSAGSLNRLRSIPIDELKLDKAFVQPVLNSPQDAAVVRLTIELAASLGIATVIDGIDSAAMYHAVAGYGCSAMQGPVICQPMAGDQLNEWLSRSLPARTMR